MGMRPIVIILLMALTTAAGSQKLQEFTGTWQINPAKVHESAVPAKTAPKDAPETPPPSPSKHEYTPEVIRQSGDVLKISGGEAGTTAIYTIDLSGQQVSDSIPDAPGVFRIANSRREEGRIVTDWKLERNGKVFMHGTDSRTLTSDGHQVVERVIESPRHRAEVRLVLDKVP
jgi:hypothetical protein